MLSLNSSTTFDHDTEDTSKASKKSNKGAAAYRSRSSQFEANQHKVEELGGEDGSTGSLVEEEQYKKGKR